MPFTPCGWVCVCVCVCPPLCVTDCVSSTLREKVCEYASVWVLEYVRWWACPFPSVKVTDSSCHHVIMSSGDHVIMSSSHHLIMSSCRHLIITIGGIIGMSSSDHVIMSSGDHVIMSSSDHVIMSSSHHVMRPHKETVKEAPHSKSAEGEGATRGVRCVFSAILVVLNCMFFSSFSGRTIEPMIVCFD